MVANSIFDVSVSNSTSYKNFAILYRTNAQSRVLEDQLRKKKVSYKIFGNISFYDRAEIKDLVGYLRLIVNPNDGVAFNRIINTPARGIGEKTLEKLSNIQHEENCNYLDLIRTSLGKKVFSKKSEILVSGLIEAIDSYYSSLEKGVPLSDVPNNCC